MHTAVPRACFVPEAGLPDLGCGRCDMDLDFHIPDPHRPDRLLGTCPTCGAWTLIDAEAGLAMTLPDRLSRDWPED